MAAPPGERRRRSRKHLPPLPPGVFFFLPLYEIVFSILRNSVKRNPWNVAEKPVRKPRDEGLFEKTVSMSREARQF
jgi:hypothetical protein